jgi:hypothetical protein
MVFTHSTAVFDVTRMYRYALIRAWGHTRSILWIMLNPSIADETILDPTVRRCLGFSEAWGFDRLTICNIFALRSTDPRALYHHTDPVGPENDDIIHANAHTADIVIAAWGVHGALAERSSHVIKNLARQGVRVHHLGLTKHGFPKHPLYLRATSVPIPF